MATFEQAVTKLLGHEGGYSDHPADTGGRTRYGITEAVARRHGYIGYMSELPRETALQIYLADYWAPIRGDALPQVVADRLFDFAVNAGVSRAVRALQRALRVTDDGMLGPGTLQALTDYETIELAELIAERVRIEQIRHYRDVVTRNPGQAVFLLGWLNRALA